MNIKQRFPQQCMSRQYSLFKQRCGFIDFKAKLLLAFKGVRSTEGSDELGVGGVGHYLSAAGFEPHSAALVLRLGFLENSDEGARMC